MIYLEKGQKVFDTPDLVVYESTGERNDTDMVICAKVETPEEPFCWLEAQYIAYGGVVYAISDDKELEKEILKTDPDSTIHDVATTPVDRVIVEDPAPITSATTTPQVAPEPSPETGAGSTSPTPQTPPSTSGEPISGSGTSTPALSETDTATSTTATTTPETISEPAVPPVVEVPAEIVPEVVPDPIPVVPETVTPPPVVEETAASIAPEAIISTSSRRGRRKLG